LVCCFAALIFACAAPAYSQTKPAGAAAKPAPAQLSSAAIEHAVALGQQGKCQEAMPVLRKALGHVEGKDLKQQVGAAGVRCAMFLLNTHQDGAVFQEDATSFTNWLKREFPNDPDVLYLAVHVYSDLSTRATQDLYSRAPNSPQVIQMNAENYEARGDWKTAMEQYKILLRLAPNQVGIHLRMGQLILAQPQAATSLDDARKEFEAELKSYPQSGLAEYYLGEIARQADQLPEAVQHFWRATQINASLGDAFFGLGRSLLDSDRTAEAIAPLETAARQKPDVAEVHFYLATAYQRMGRKDEAAKEFAVQKELAEHSRKATSTMINGLDTSRK
jgi:tetratricopeptide (TPR) repeat protein